jgi:hypothetical protein
MPVYVGSRPDQGCAGPVAQLDRASPSEGEGRTFESCRVRQVFRYFPVPATDLAVGVANT